MDATMKPYVMRGDRVDFGRLADHRRVYSWEDETVFGGSYYPPPAVEKGEESLDTDEPGY